MEFFVSREFESIQVSIGWEEGEISPEDVDDGTGISSGRRSEHKGGEGK